MSDRSQVHDPFHGLVKPKLGIRPTVICEVFPELHEVWCYSLVAW